MQFWLLLVRPTTPNHAVGERYCCFVIPILAFQPTFSIILRPTAVHQLSRQPRDPREGRAGLGGLQGVPEGSRVLNNQQQGKETPRVFRGLLQGLSQQGPLQAWMTKVNQTTRRRMGEGSTMMMMMMMM